MRRLTAHVDTHKWVGSAASFLAYLDEEDERSDKESEKARRYYATIADSDIVFPNVGGKAGAFLDGLDMELGLNKEQHARIHNGNWSETARVEPGYAKVWHKDRTGEVIKLENPETGRFEPIPVMDPETGKQKMEKVHVAGYDMPIELDKSPVEFVIKNPQYREIFKECLIEAANGMMTVAVEDRLALVAKTVAKPSEVGPRRTKTEGSATTLVKAEGLLWYSTFQTGSRPTTKSTERGYADPLFHLHVFLSSMAKTETGWQKIDGRNLFKDAKFRSLVVNLELPRLLEQRGIPIEYLPPDPSTGEVYWQVAGSKKAIRRFFSTNMERIHSIKMRYEAKHGKPMTRKLLEAETQRTKGPKNGLAREADTGSPEYWAKLGEALAVEQEKIHEQQRQKWLKRFPNWEAQGKTLYEGIEWDTSYTIEIAELTNGIEYGDLLERQKTFVERLEASSGVLATFYQMTKVDITEDRPVFGPEVIEPACFKAAVGLGFSPDYVQKLAEWYRDTQLVTVRPAEDLSARLYTTKTIMASEEYIADSLEVKAGQRSDQVTDEIKEQFRSDGSFDLDEGQNNVYDEILGPKRLIHIEGPAGAGKTEPVKRAVRALRAGHGVGKVIGVARQSKRGKEFGAEIEADIAGSIEQIAGARKNGWVPSSRDVVFLDESALLNCFDMKMLLEIISPAKLVTIGDERQGVAIGAAGWRSEELAKRPATQLNKSYRTIDQKDQEAFDNIRAGYAHVALADLNDRNRLFTALDPQELVAVMMDRWKIHRESGRSAEDIGIVHQGTNHGLDVLNRFVQRDRLDKGEIGCNEEGKFDPRHVLKIWDEETNRRWSVFTNDRIIFRKGLFIKGNDPIPNGSTGLVLKIDRDYVRIRLDGKENRTITVPITNEIYPAYAQNTAKFQGGAIKVNLTNPGNPGIASRNSGYSQVTRTVEHVEVFADIETWGDQPWKFLGKCWTTPHLKLSASSFYVEDLDIDKPQTEMVWDLEERDGHLFAVEAHEEEEITYDYVEPEPDLVVVKDHIAELRESLRRGREPSEGIGRSL